MIKTIRQCKLKIIASFAALFFMCSLTVVPAYAQVDIQNSLCGGTTGSITSSPNSQSCNNIGDQNGKTKNLTSEIINILSVVVGFIAVVMLIIGGFRYITSAGDSNRVSGAKNTILYALIGLVIVASAQIIVQFVLNKTNNPTDCVNHVIQSGKNKGKSC